MEAKKARMSKLDDQPRRKTCLEGVLLAVVGVELVVILFVGASLLFEDFQKSTAGSGSVFFVCRRNISINFHYPHVVAGGQF